MGFLKEKITLGKRLGIYQYLFLCFSLWIFMYLFRLIEDDERQWTDQNVDMVALKHFPNINRDEALTRPILFSNWLSKDYVPVDREELREYTKARLKVTHIYIIIQVFYLIT